MLFGLTPILVLMVGLVVGVMGGCSGAMDGLGQWCLDNGVGVVVVAIMVGFVVIVLRVVTTSSPSFHLARKTSLYSF